MSLCIRIYVCLYSTQLNSTRLAHESAALSVSHARYSVFKQRTHVGERGREVCGGAVGGERPQPVRHFPENLS